MDINDLTIGQAKELVKFFSAQGHDEPLLTRYVGQRVIVRSINEGLNFGKVVGICRGFIVLEDARRIWRPVTKNGEPSWYEGVANVGLDRDRGKISISVQQKVIVEDYSITLCTERAAKSLMEAPANETDF
jgi:hypothetical protein